jgi:hypothetical protein
MEFSTSSKKLVGRVLLNSEDERTGALQTIFETTEGKIEDIRHDGTLRAAWRRGDLEPGNVVTIDSLRSDPSKLCAASVRADNDNDPDSKITAPGDMLIFINGVAPIYGVQSLYFLNDALLARTKLKPPAFRTAAQPHAQPAPSRQTALDITSIAATAIDQQAIEEKLNGNS